MKIQRASIVSATILSSAFLLSSCTSQIQEAPIAPQKSVPTEKAEEPQQSSDKKPPHQTRQKCGVTIYCMVA